MDFSWLPFVGRKTKPARSPRRYSRRNYDAAKADRLKYNWGQGAVSINDALRQDLLTLVARSREQRHNNDWCRAFVRQVSRNVVGPTGIVTQADTINADGKRDREANAAIDLAFTEWSRARACDVAGKLTWPDMQRLWVETVANEGAAVILKHGSGEFGLQLQLVDNLLLDVDYNVDHKGLRIIMGVEVDWSLRPVAYHFISSGGTAGYGARRHRRVMADQIMYSYVAEEVGQVRGIPWTATALPRLYMLDGYEDAALTAARAGAAKMGHYTTDDGGGKYVGDDTTDDGQIIEEVEAGINRVLPPGWRYESNDPTYPHQQYADFTKSQLRAIASSLGVSYNGLANDLEGVNYSSMRSGKLDEWDIWRTLQDWMVGELVSPVYQQWLTSAISLGMIQISGKALSLTRLEKYTRAVHQGRRWPWVDPQKEATANIANIRARITSRSQIIRDMGKDPDDVFREIAAEEEKLSELGIAPLPEAAGEVIMTGEVAPDENETEEPDKSAGGVAE